MLQYVFPERDLPLRSNCQQSLVLGCRSCWAHVLVLTTYHCKAECPYLRVASHSCPSWLFRLRSRRILASVRLYNVMPNRRLSCLIVLFTLALSCHLSL